MRRWITPMHARSRTEAHRASSPLELFFDLVFVVAIAYVADAFHHAVAEGRVLDGLVTYAMGFFGIWWAWMNFTWFASAYDTDDVAYRLVVFLVLAGALVFASGVSRFAARDFSIGILGYVIMRIALVGLWLRAARSDPARRPAAHRYALGISACQACWVAFMWAPQEWMLPGFIVLAVADLLTPVWAERAALTPWHPGHIAERYGLFTIIVLGESVLAASIAIQAALEAGDLTAEFTTTILGRLIIVYAMWWLYFDRPGEHLPDTSGAPFGWGYGHFPVFAAAAAVGAGLAVATDHAAGVSRIGLVGAGASIAVPVAIYLLGLWLLHERPWDMQWGRACLTPGFALLILLTPITSQAVLLTGLLLAALLAVRLATRR